MWYKKAFAVIEKTIASLFFTKETSLTFLTGLLAWQPEDLKLEKSLETSLFGNESNLDSLGLVNFLVEVENIIKVNIDQDICVINEELFLGENGPYDNVKTLLEYIFKQIKWI